ncbi:MAG: transposase [Trueperaceae bacterium]|nr:transposase [Trueperaceae bacterium]
MREFSTTTEVLFDRSFTKPLVARFDQPRSSSDAGAVLLRLLDDRLGITLALAAALPDARDATRVQHPQLDLVRQRVYAIACGYEDGNDAARLRFDPTQRLLLGRDPFAGPPLGSQPTLSRFENRHALRSLIRGAEAIADTVIAAHRQRVGKRVKRITIDLDGTVDPAYGNQWVFRRIRPVVPIDPGR